MILRYREGQHDSVMLNVMKITIEETFSDDFLENLKVITKKQRVEQMEEVKVKIGHTLSRNKHFL